MIYKYEEYIHPETRISRSRCMPRVYTETLTRIYLRVHRHVPITQGRGGKRLGNSGYTDVEVQRKKKYYTDQAQSEIPLVSQLSRTSVARREYIISSGIYYNRQQQHKPLAPCITESARRCRHARGRHPVQQQLSREAAVATALPPSLSNVSSLLLPLRRVPFPSTTLAAQHSVAAQPLFLSFLPRRARRATDQHPLSLSLPLYISRKRLCCCSLGHTDSRTTIISDAPRHSHALERK